MGRLLGGPRPGEFHLFASAIRCVQVHRPKETPPRPPPAHLPGCALQESTPKEGKRTSAGCAAARRRRPLPAATGSSVVVLIGLAREAGQRRVHRKGRVHGLRARQRDNQRRGALPRPVWVDSMDDELEEARQGAPAQQPAAAGRGASRSWMGARHRRSVAARPRHLPPAGGPAAALASVSPSPHLRAAVVREGPHASAMVLLWLALPANPALHG
mmetsp:Transcript_28219/g.80928  ORF Transcript_28219/g.80928 Transcript_28219/m.80928 type:complete len:215 (+) Transcript_28219:865-1509(+)